MFRNILLAGLMSAGLAGAAEAQTVIKVGHTHSEGHSFHLAMDKFAELLEQRAPGEFKVDMYSQAKLGSEREMQEQLTFGTLEITITGVLGIFEPKVTLLELPYLFRDREHARAAQKSEQVKALESSLPEKGVRVIGYVENGFRNVTNNVRPINAPGDVSGLKIRTPENLAQVETFKALGAAPTPMPFSELYAALRQGVVDGQENPLQNIFDGKLFEVQKNLALTGHIYSATPIIISEPFFDGLSEEQQAHIVAAMSDATDWQIEYIAAKEEEILGNLKEAGMQVSEPDRASFKTATEPAYEAFYAKFGDEARELVKAIQDM